LLEPDAALVELGAAVLEPQLLIASASRPASAAHVRYLRMVGLGIDGGS
jgi:hypothetical protein